VRIENGVKNFKAPPAQRNWCKSWTPRAVLKVYSARTEKMFRGTDLLSRVNLFVLCGGQTQRMGGGDVWNGALHEVGGGKKSWPNWTVRTGKAAGCNVFGKSKCSH